MNPNMFNPEMMNQMKSMINPQMMKQAAESFSGMSDDQIKSYLNASGMGNISPQMFRQMSGNLKNMEDKDLERIKNNAPNPNNYTRANSSPTYSTNNTTSTNTKTNLDYNYKSCEPSKPKTIIQNLEEIKNKGNDFFRQGKYKEACEKYYEVLNELEYIPDSEKITFKKEIDDMEIVCRLNIANSKLKLEDYDLVIHECLKVLKRTENFKAHYRAGLSFYKKGNYSKAHFHFSKAKEINKNEEAQQIEKYLKECQIFLDDMEKEKEEIRNRERKAEEEAEMRRQRETENKLIEERNNIDDSNTNTEKQKSKYDKLREIVNQEVKLDDKKKKEDEILIEEEKPKREYVEETVNTNMNSQSGSFNYNPDLMNKAESQIKNMSDSEVGNMANMLKSMDNATIKSIMQMQGMNLSDEQISMMKNSITPDTMKMMKNFQGNPGMKSGSNTNSSNTSNNLNTSTSANVECSNTSGNTNISANAEASTAMPSLKGFPDLKNMDFSSMMKFVQDNPNLMNMMGPQMSQMFGGQGGANNEMMMKSMQNILWFISLPQRAKSFFSSTRGILLLVLIFGLIIAYFYR